MENVEEHEDPWACGDHSEDDHLHLASSCHGASTRINSLSLQIFSKMVHCQEVQHYLQGLLGH